MADPRLDAVIAALGGMAEIEKWNAKGNSLLLGYANEQVRVGELEGVVSAHLAGHRTISPGVTADDIANAITGGIQNLADLASYYLLNGQRQNYATVRNGALY